MNLGLTPPIFYDYYKDGRVKIFYYILYIVKAKI